MSDEFDQTTEFPTIWVTDRTELKETAPTFFVLAGERAGFKIPVETNLTIGRDEACGFRLASTSVSRKHAVIRTTPTGEFLIRDLDSVNGVLINDKPVHGEHVLRLGDRVSIAGVSLLLFTAEDGLNEEFLHHQRMESIGLLAGGIAHDFNNLLGALLSNLAYLEGFERSTPLGDAEVREVLDDVSTSAQRAATLTRELLAVARRNPTKQRAVDLTRLTTEVASILKRRFLSASIELTMDCQDDLYVLGDSVQLHQVVLNLCMNALEAMPNGGQLSIRVRHELGAEAGLPVRVAVPLVRIDVTDTGVGMSEDVRRRVFEPFFTTKQSGEGTGLGLAAAYGIVSSHGGRLSVKTSLGEGSTFSVRLPQMNRPMDSASSTAPFYQDQQQGHVLLVDDEELQLRATARLLRRLGFSVRTALSGEDALAAFESDAGQFDVVILDLMMPGLGGRETLEQIRQRRPGQPVVLATGYSEPEDLSSLTSFDKHLIIHKPYGRKELQVALTRAMESDSAGTPLRG